MTVSCPSSDLCFVSNSFILSFFVIFWEYKFLVFGYFLYPSCISIPVLVNEYSFVDPEIFVRMGQGSTNKVLTFLCVFLVGFGGSVSGSAHHIRPK